MAVSCLQGLVAASWGSYFMVVTASGQQSATLCRMSIDANKEWRVAAKGGGTTERGPLPVDALQVGGHDLA